MSRCGGGCGFMGFCLEKREEAKAAACIHPPPPPPPLSTDPPWSSMAQFGKTRDASKLVDYIRKEKAAEWMELQSKVASTQKILRKARAQRSAMLAAEEDVGTAGEDRDMVRANWPLPSARAGYLLPFCYCYFFSCCLPSNRPGYPNQVGGYDPVCSSGWLRNL